MSIRLLALASALLSPGCMVGGMFTYGVANMGFDGVDEGDPAPDATLVALEGFPTTLAAHYGERPLVLVFGSFT